MSRPTEPVPVAARGNATYWTTRWRDDSGKPRLKRFGRADGPKPVTKRMAHARWAHWLQHEWQEKPEVRNPAGPEAQYSVGQLCDDFEEHAKTYYVKHGRQTGTQYEIVSAMAELRSAYGNRIATTIGAPELATLRDRIVTGPTGKTRYMRTVNGHLHYWQAAFAWARERGLVTAACAADVGLVQRLRKGRSAARDPRDVKPVAQEVVEAAGKSASTVIRDMLLVQWHTGMRPDEVCALRACDIDMSQAVWIYTPAEHKTEHHDKRRRIALGPQVQEVLTPYLRSMHGYLFCPRAAATEDRAKRRKKRKSDVWPSHAARYAAQRVEEPQRAPGDRYTTGSYRRAIHRACERAGIAAFNPNQIRHAWATRVRALYGIEGASAGLGHSNLRTTEIYAEQSLEKAIEVARKVG